MKIEVIKQIDDKTTINVNELAKGVTIAEKVDAVVSMVEELEKKLLKKV